ncbi:MAG: hypothetical protein ABIL66_04715 [candidate division WOR-3 bacterium]
MKLSLNLLDFSAIEDPMKVLSGEQEKCCNGYWSCGGTVSTQ